MSGMNVDADRLAEALARRLAAIVPDGFHVRADDGMLWYSSDPGRFPGQLSNYQVGSSGTYVRDNLDTRDDTAEDRVTVVAAQALDELQDYVDEASHDPWPGVRKPPRPHADIREQALYLWYGGPDISSPAILACEPIPLTEIEQLS
jgi:hypothetical protein